MLRECIEVFEHMLSDQGMKIILNTYIPVDGTYIIVGKDGSISNLIDIKMDTKTKKVERSSRCFADICYYDYNSQLISMNKPVDGKKIIHSNNYMSFWVKKESILSGKLTDEIIDGYYDILEDPLERKYKKSKEASKIYQLFEETEGPVPKEEIEKNRRWIKEHIYRLDSVDMSRKDYLKIFFEADYETYEKEGKRYFLPNIYNNNDYNVEIENRIYGLPDNNVGMNAKKPLLSIKTRKYAAPYLLDKDQVMTQKLFFDYLMNMASVRKYHVYVDTELKKIEAYPMGQAPKQVESGYYFRIKKGKNEAEILTQDNIVDYRQGLHPPFYFQKIIDADYKKHPDYFARYGEYDSRLAVGQLINEVLFSNYLSGNYFSEANEININDGIIKENVVVARDIIFDWIYKGIDSEFSRIIDIVSLNLIKGALLNGYRERALWQFDLRYSFQNYFLEEGEKNMAETISRIKESIKYKVLANEIIPLDNDEEYFYAVGQLAAFFVSLSKAKDKKQSLINPFLNAKSDKIIRDKIKQLYKKYNYAIPYNSKRVKNLLAMVVGYEAEGIVDQEKIILGYTCDNVIYMKEDN